MKEFQCRYKFYFEAIIVVYAYFLSFLCHSLEYIKLYLHSCTAIYNSIGFYILNIFSNNNSYISHRLINDSKNTINREII